jgi:hypothetical protein
VRHTRPVHEEVDERWAASIAAGDEMMDAANVRVVNYSSHLGGSPVLYNGELYYP